MAGYGCTETAVPMGFNWISASGGSIPPNSMFVGRDGRDMTYVGRAHYKGDLIPGKVVPSHRGCYVSYDGKEHKVNHYEVLTTNGGQYQWVFSSNGSMPPNPIQGGRTSSGEPLYIGRHHHFHDGDVIVPGKIHPSHGCLYVPYGGKEHRYNEYEVLVSSSPFYPSVQPAVCPAYPGRPGVYPAIPSYPAYPTGTQYPPYPGQPGSCNPPW